MTDGRASAHAPLDVEALTVAMTLAPGVYSRNRLFHFFDTPPARAARRRAALLRGLARHLATREDIELVSTEREDGGFTLTYRIRSLRLTRTLDVTDVERAVVAHLTARAGGAAVLVSPRDRTLVEAALARLAPALALPRASYAPPVQEPESHGECTEHRSEAP